MQGNDLEAKSREGEEDCSKDIVVYIYIYMCVCVCVCVCVFRFIEI